MKNLIIFVVVLFASTCIYAQNYVHINVTEIENLQTFDFCVNEYEGVVVGKDPSCTDWVSWTVTNFSTGEWYEYTSDEIVVQSNLGSDIWIEYYDGCEIASRSFRFYFHDFQITEPWTDNCVWKRIGSPITLLVTYVNGLQYLWSTGSTEDEITTTEPGVYWVRIYNDCGELTDTIQVRDNVEISLATCDLESNLNMVTWPTTVAQAEYVDHLNVKRDGITVATANYSDGQFTDNIGSGSASRTYTITAVATDGTECPIVSYPKETIHMSYTLGMNNTIEIGWNTPMGYDLLGYNICEWHEEDGSLSVIDFVGASVTSYTCSESQFDQGYIVVQGVENGKDCETRLLSNRSLDLVGLGENEATAFKVYPNPANGILFVETVCTPSLPVETYRIMNPIGQTVMQGQITSEKQQIDVRNLPNGVYFITVGGATRKFVVE